MIALQQPPQVRVCPCTPSVPLMTRMAQSSTWRVRSISLEKSTWPGVSSRVTSTPGSGSTACLEKMVMPRSRSSASVSRKASWWSTRPSRFSVPQVYSIPSDKVVFPASTWAKIPMTSFLMVPLPVPKTAGRHCPAGPLCSVYSHFRGFSPQIKPKTDAAFAFPHFIRIVPERTSSDLPAFRSVWPKRADFQQMLQKWFYIFISFSILKIYFHFVIMQLLNLKTEGSLCALTLISALTP